jgi:hypothetical protein
MNNNTQPSEAPAIAAATARTVLPARQLARLRGSSFGALVMLILQFAIGMVVNLYVTVPASDQGSGFFSALGKALSHGPAALASHAGLGVLLVVAAIALLGRAIQARHAPTIVLASVGLLAIAAAAVNGVRFVSDGGASNASLAMALSAAVAMLCYATSLLVLGGARTAS